MRVGGVILLMAMTGVASAAPPPTVMILYFDNNTGTEELAPLGKGLADMFTTDLAGVGGLQLVERQRLDAVLQEQALQQTAAFDPATAVKVGKLLGAEFAVTGSLVSATASDVRIDVRVVRVDNGQVVKTARVAGARTAFFDLQQQLVTKLAEGLTTALNLPPAEARRIQKQLAADNDNHLPDLALAVEYGRALDLADRGDAAGSATVLEKIIAAAPGFVLGRTRLLEAMRNQLARYALGAPDRKLLDACKAISRSGMLCEQKAPAESAAPQAPPASQPAETATARPSGYALETSLRTSMGATATGSESSLTGGIFLGLLRERWFIGLGFELAFTSAGKGTPGLTTILLGPGIRWSFFQSADKRFEILGVADLQYRLVRQGGEDISPGLPSTSDNTSGLALDAGQGFRYWLHPRFALGTTVGLRADFLFAESTSKNLAVFVAFSLLGAF